MNKDYQPTTIAGFERELEKKRADYKRMCGANNVMRDLDFFNERFAALKELGFVEKAIYKILERVKGNKPYFSNKRLVDLSEEIAALERKLAGERSLIGVEVVEGRLRVAFPSRPSVKVIEALKGRQFRWSPGLGGWMGVNTADNREFAEGLKGENF